MFRPSGISGGWIFIIIVVVAIPIYILVGMAYQWKLKGKACGVEAIPNIEFWKDLPALIKVKFCSLIYVSFLLTGGLLLCEGQDLQIERR